jgi:DNA-binding MurR/RpiR family transcriptional regulator
MMQSIEQIIVEKLPQYSKSQKNLANFILENLTTIPLLSVNQVAGKSGISTASVVRFVRLLGFNGYLEFRNQLTTLLKEQLSPLERYKSTLSHKNELENSMEKVSQQVIDNIHYSLAHNQLNEFKHIVRHIHQAESIFCVGMGLSFYLSEIMVYLLKLYMKRASVISNDSPSIPEQILLITPRDLLIVFSFPPYSRQSVEAANQARGMKIPVVAFTDKRTSPVCEYSEHVLVAKTDNILFTNSLGAISMLMNALITELALSEEDKVLDGLQKSEAFMHDKRYYY